MLDDATWAADRGAKLEGMTTMQTLADLDLPHLPMETSAFAADPFPHFEAARAQHPWLAHSVFGLVVTEYGAMKDLLAIDGSLRTANDGVVAIMGAKGAPSGRFFEANIFNQQGDAHRRLRDALAPIFTPRHANEIRPLMREVIDELLDAWAPMGRFEFQEFASYFPISVLSRMIGGPVEDIPRLRSSLEAVSLFFSLDRSRMPEIEAALVVIEDFVQGLLADRRAKPAHEGEKDLLDMLIGAGADGRLSDREIADLLVFLYTAGYDTSKNVLTLIMRQMIERPDLYARCAADAEFCGKIVEEMMRFNGVSTSTRLTTEDLEYRGVLVPKDTMLFFPVSVAGRDPGSFADPNSFDPDRPVDPQHRHIGFGRGPHLCLGQHIARVQLQEGLQLIARRIREPKLAGEIEWRPFPGIWGLKTLPIAFTPA
jgi:cytochrome P450